jgi:hypothetical protein
MDSLASLAASPQAGESRPTYQYQPNQKPNPTRPDGGGSPTSEQRPSVLRTQPNQTESGQIPSGFPSLQISLLFIHPDVANRKILTTQANRDASIPVEHDGFVRSV